MQLFGHSEDNDPYYWLTSQLIWKTGLERTLTVIQTSLGKGALLEPSNSKTNKRRYVSDRATSHRQDGCLFSHLSTLGKYKEWPDVRVQEYIGCWPPSRRTKKERVRSAAYEDWRPKETVFLQQGNVTDLWWLPTSANTSATSLFRKEWKKGRKSLRLRVCDEATACVIWQRQWGIIQQVVVRAASSYAPSWLIQIYISPPIANRALWMETLLSRVAQGSSCSGSAMHIDGRRSGS